MKSPFFRIAILMFAVPFSSCASQQHSAICNSNNEDFSGSIAAAALGDAKALGEILKSLECLDGGNLEDAHVALGEALFKSPQRIAPIIESANAATSDLAAMATMLGPQFVDEPCSQAKELRKRLTLVAEDSALDFARATMFPALKNSVSVQESECSHSK